MKVAFLGSGQVGGQTAFLTALNGLADVCLYDSDVGRAHGKALDIGQSLAAAGPATQATVADELPGTADSDVIVVSAGISRRPGMQRSDLLATNAAIIADLLPRALQASPDAVVIIVTNPVTSLSQFAWQLSGLPKSRVIGMAGLLDNARFKYFVSQAIGCRSCDVNSLVIGDHGDHAVPVFSHATVAGRPLCDCLDAEQLTEVRRQTRSAGTAIVNLLQQSSAFHAPSVAIMTMLNAILYPDDTLLPCCVGLGGEFGVSGLYAGAPAQLGKNGVKRIVELELSTDERRDFDLAVESIRRTNEWLPATKPHTMGEAV